MKIKRRVYIAIYNFPPIGIGRGLAWHYFANILKDNDYDVTVITVKPSNNDPYYNKGKLKLIEKAKYDIIRLNDSKLYYKVYSNKTVNITTNTAKKKQMNVKNFFVKYAIKMYRKMTRIIFYPDRMFFWSKKVKKYLNEKNLCENDIVISVGFPFSTHLEIGKLRRKKNFKLILDYGDPWSFNPSTDTEPKWRKRFDYYIEKKLLKIVDYVTVTTDKTAQLFKKIFKIENVEVIRQGVNTSDYNMKELEKKKDVITLVYTGIFYKEIRDPTNFFNALKKLDASLKFKIEILIAGRIDPYFSGIIDKLEMNNMKNIKIELLGNVDIKDAIKLQNIGDILLFFSNKEGIQVPGKIYEYFATDKPIIDIAYNFAETEQLIEKHKRGKIILNNENIEEELLKVLEEYHTNKKIHGIENKRIKDYDWENISRKFLNIIKKVEKDEKNNNY